MKRSGAQADLPVAEACALHPKEGKDGHRHELGEVEGKERGEDAPIGAAQHLHAQQVGSAGKDAQPHVGAQVHARHAHIAGAGIVADGAADLFRLWDAGVGDAAQLPEVIGAQRRADEAQRKDDLIAQRLGKGVENPAADNGGDDKDQGDDGVAHARHLAAVCRGDGRGIHGVERNCQDCAGDGHEQHQAEVAPHLDRRREQPRQHGPQQKAGAAERGGPEYGAAHGASAQPDTRGQGKQQPDQRRACVEQPHLKGRRAQTRHIDTQERLTGAGDDAKPGHIPIEMIEMAAQLRRKRGIRLYHAQQTGPYRLQNHDHPIQVTCAPRAHGSRKFGIIEV